jgi:hypothetical protein
MTSDCFDIDTTNDTMNATTNATTDDVSAPVAVGQGTARDVA